MVEDHELPIFEIQDDYVSPISFFPTALINTITETLRALIFVPNERLTKSNIRNRATIFADILIHELKIIGTNRLFLWNQSCYSSDCVSRLLNLIETLHRNLGIEYTVAKSKEILEILLSRTDIHDTDGKILNNYPAVIPMANKYYDIETHSVINPNPAMFFTYAFTINYVPTATCPRFLQFMEEILPNSIYRRKIILFLAYAMTSTLKLQKAMIWYGEGSNGKSTFLDLIKELWGSLYSNVALQELNEKYITIEFRGKLLNIGPDLPETRIEEEGKIKECITENALSSDEKYCERTRFHNTTKHIYGCNEIPLPPIKAGMAFFRRWILIPFFSIFKSKTDPDFDPAIHKEKDINLLSKLIEEKEGILVYLISHIDYINELDITDWRTTKNEWISHSESTLQYYVECEQGSSVSCNCSILYENYKKWCLEKRAKITSRKHFDNILAQQGFSKERISSGFGEFEWKYVGINIPNKDHPSNPFEQ